MERHRLAVSFESSTTAAYGIYYVPNAAAGTHTFTVTLSTAASYYLFAEEFSGVATSAPLDGTMPAINTGSGTTTPASNSVTPSHSGDLAITGLTALATAETFSSWTNGFALGNSGNANLGSAWAYQIYNAISALTGGVTLSNATSYGMGIVLFKPSTSACTDAGITQAGVVSVPNGTSGLYLSPSGTLVTPDCATVQYWKPPTVACGVGFWAPNGWAPGGGVGMMVLNCPPTTPGSPQGTAVVN